MGKGHGRPVGGADQGDAVAEEPRLERPDDHAMALRVEHLLDDAAAGQHAAPPVEGEQGHHVVVREATQRHGLLLPRAHARVCVIVDGSHCGMRACKIEAHACVGGCRWVPLRVCVSLNRE